MEEPDFLLASSGGLVLWQSNPNEHVYDTWSSALVRAAAVSRVDTKSRDDIMCVKQEDFVSAAHRRDDNFYIDGLMLQAALEHLIKLAREQKCTASPDSPFLPPDDWFSTFQQEYKRNRIEEKKRGGVAKDSSVLPQKQSWLQSLKEKFAVVKQYESLPQMLQTVEEKLQAKNVAQAASVAISSAVKEAFTKRSAPPLTSANLLDVFEHVLIGLLTPSGQRQLIEEVMRAKASKRIFSIVVMGVNGVGKSTTLAKLAHYLRKNLNCTILLAACDTFRSGAVEQLRKHASSLGIELYERGYGTEPALVGQAAISKAAKEGTDVVLIDTAGRMQDNAPLMQALGKLVASTNPDMLLFVGEALVGNDGLDQLMKFDRALRSGTAFSGNPRTLDGIILTKFDTVDDKIGAAITMSFESQKPIMFVGTGQTYDDLRLLEARDIAMTLLA